jgi:hypothetical protein
MALVHKYRADQSNSELERTKESWDKTERKLTRPHSTVRKDGPEKVLVCGDKLPVIVS